MAYFDNKKSGSHPNFQGIRVTGARHKQQYFPNTVAGRAEARALDKVWQAQDEAARQAAHDLAKPQPRKKSSTTMTTGVAGLYFTVSPEEEGRRACLYIKMQVQDVQGVRVSRSRTIKYEWDVDIVVKELLTIRAEAKGYQSIPKHWKINGFTARKLNAFIKRVKKNGVAVGDLHIGY